MKQQLFNFKKPIAKFYLDGSEFVGFDRLWQTFDAAALLDGVVDDVKGITAATTTNTKAKG